MSPKRLPNEKKKCDSRRRLRWENVKGLRATSAVIAATALGAGLFPAAPGTMGALVTLPLAYAMAGTPWFAKAALWLAILAIGTWAAKVFDETMTTEDNQNIVIDEVLGMGIAAWTAGTHVKTLIVAFILFRLFDIIKPAPIRQADRWSKVAAKNGNGWAGGFGVMFDDLLAGLQSLIVIIVLQHFGVLP